MKETIISEQSLVDETALIVEPIADFWFASDRSLIADRTRGRRMTRSYPDCVLDCCSMQPKDTVNRTHSEGTRSVAPGAPPPPLALLRERWTASAVEVRSKARAGDLHKRRSGASWHPQFPFLRISMCRTAVHFYRQRFKACSSLLMQAMMHTV
eukprot:1525186-Pleurochrysis_carterae.AAC.3